MRNRKLIIRWTVVLALALILLFVSVAGAKGVVRVSRNGTVYRTSSRPVYRYSRYRYPLYRGADRRYPRYRYSRIQARQPVSRTVYVKQRVNLANYRGR